MVTLYQCVYFGRIALRVWFKHGLVRVIAFLIVGITVIVSTQLLRGQNPEEVSNNLRLLINKTFFVGTPAPQSVETRLSDARTLDANPQVSNDAERVVVVAPKTLTFAADQSTAPIIAVPAYCADRDVAAGSIVLGDKIQLRFFAAVRLPSAEADFSSTAQANSVAYERLDLSGIYDISEDGTAALPLIGRIDLAGQPLACAEAVVAREITALDTSVSSVNASFAARLPVTISGAVRAPGAYTHAPGMTVNRLLNLAGATFEDGPITPQDFESLIGQRNELRHRQILAAAELGRLIANMSGNDSIVMPDGLAINAPITLPSALIDAETSALRQDLAVGRTIDARSAVAIAGLEQRFKDTRSQLGTVKSQIASLQARYDEMASFKSRGLIQASQLDVAQSNLMELNRIGMQLETDQSSLQAQIALAKEDAQLAIQVRLQGFSQRAAALSGEISLLDVQLSAIGSRLAGHGFGEDSADFALPLVVTVLRTGTNGAVRLTATLDTVIFPGDMVTISMSANLVEKQRTADNIEASDTGAVASGNLQP